jgi:hypothetical protein
MEEEAKKRETFKAAWMEFDESLRSGFENHPGVNPCRAPGLPRDWVHKKHHGKRRKNNKVTFGNACLTYAELILVNTRMKKVLRFLGFPTPAYRPCIRMCSFNNNNDVKPE